MVSVFAGLPDEAAPLGSWDRLSCASSSRGRQLERREEDRAALETFDVTFEHWDFLDAQYRGGAPPDREAIAASLAPMLSSESELWLPAGIGHVDHAAVSDAALDAASRLGLVRVHVYADVPHAIPYGWPPSVTHRDPVEWLDPDAWLADQLRQRGFEESRLTQHVVRLDSRAAGLKRRALEMYRTQLPALGLGAERLARDPDMLRFELFWSCAPLTPS